MSLFHSIRTHWLRNVHSAEYTSRLNTYYRCLLNWSHYQSPQRERALALASIRLEEMEKGWSFLHPWDSLANTVENLFSRPKAKAQAPVAPERSCLAGLARAVVAAPPQVALKVRPPDGEPLLGCEPLKALVPAISPPTIQRTSIYASSNMFRK